MHTKQNLKIAIVLCATILALGAASRDAASQRTANAPAPPPAFGSQQALDTMLDRLQQSLDANAEDWAVIASRAKTVFDLQNELAAFEGRPVFDGAPGGPGGQGRPGMPPAPGAAMGMKPNDGAMPGPPPQAGPPPGARAIPREVERLRGYVDDQESSEGSIQTALQAFRSARAKHIVDLRAAQDSLRNVINTRQEGILVLMHMLD